MRVEEPDRIAAQFIGGAALPSVSVPPESVRARYDSRSVTLLRAIVSEGVGTAFLLSAVVGSGIMGERLSEGNVALALLANSLATGAALVVLILTFGPVSGAHFNPAVSLAEVSRGGISWRAAGWYIAAQIVGAFVGVALVHLMF